MPKCCKQVIIVALVLFAVLLFWLCGAVCVAKKSYSIRELLPADHLYSDCSDRIQQYVDGVLSDSIVQCGAPMLETYHIIGGEDRSVVTVPLAQYEIRDVPPAGQTYWTFGVYVLRMTWDGDVFKSVRHLGYTQLKSYEILVHADQNTTLWLDFADKMDVWFQNELSYGFTQEDLRAMGDSLSFVVGAATTSSKLERNKKTSAKITIMLETPSRPLISDRKTLTFTISGETIYYNNIT